jgi:hypothetical protein
MQMQQDQKNTKIDKQHQRKMAKLEKQNQLKKQKCIDVARRDKKGARKAVKVVKQPLNKAGCSNMYKSSNSKGKQEEKDICGNCGYTYGHDDDPFIEDLWYRCSVCDEWYHESCGTFTKKRFLCNKC